MENNDLASSQLTQDMKKLVDEVLSYLEQDACLDSLRQTLEAKKAQLIDVQVRKESGYVQPEPIKIAETAEQMELILGKEAEVDYRRILLVELLANSMDNNSVALKKGLASLVVNHSNNGVEEDIALLEEENAFNLLAHCYGLERVIDFAVDNTNAFTASEINDLNRITELLDYNYQYRQKGKQSNYAQIQKQIIDALAKRDDLNPALLEDFQLNLCSNPALLEETGYEYPELATVEEYFQKINDNHFGH